MAGRYTHCMARIAEAAGRTLTDAEIENIFERIHKAALDIKAGRAITKMSKKAAFRYGWTMQTKIEEIAAEAAEQLKFEADTVARQANLQIVRLGARLGSVNDQIAKGVAPLDAVKNTIARNYRGVNVDSLEAKVAGQKANLERKLLPTWDALGSDWLGFFQDPKKLLDLVKELRGEDTGNALAKKGAKAFHDVAEEARQLFNRAGGVVGKLDDWGMPQHHSQIKVASIGKDAWVDAITPMLDRSRYVDDNGVAWTDEHLKIFLEHAWNTIATNGIANLEPGVPAGFGKRANRHAEARQIHFKDADSLIQYWDKFGERTAIEIMMGHIETMAKDIAFIDHFGPNPNVTYATIRDTALKQAAEANPVKTTNFEGQAGKLDDLYNYASGRIKPTVNQTMSAVADAISHLNTAGKLGGAAIASLFGDRAMGEAVSHLNDLPAMQRWSNQIRLLNPAAKDDRRLLMQQGLMLDFVRSGLQRFNEQLGQTSTTGKIANAVMRMTGMNAVNEIPKGALGLTMMDAIGNQVREGKTFADLATSDVRLLRNYGITESDWGTWQLAHLEDMGHGNEHVLTPESISKITDDELRAAGVIGQADTAEQAAVVRDNAIVKLLGAVNTEIEFAIVTPGWSERATFYANLQRGTAWGEIGRSILQFKSFPWAMFLRGMDAVANQDTPASKAGMTAYLIVSTTLAGAMIMQTREVLSGRDPLAMRDENWWKFWGKAFLQGGALGIYGDFLYSANQTRYGSGPLEALAGPTIGPLLELGIVQPMNAARNAIEGKEGHLAAQTLQDVKGFIPGNNIWYLKGALDNMIWGQVFELLSPGYIASIRQKTLKDFHQDRWWVPGELTPERAPDFEKAVAP